MRADRRVEPVLELVDVVAIGRGRRVAAVGEAPEALGPRASVVDDEEAPGDQLLHSGKRGHRRRDEPGSEIDVERLGIGPSLHQLRGEQGLDLGGEREAASGRRVVERFHAGAVAREDQAAPPQVEDREREHAFEAGEEAVALLLVEVGEHFGVAARAEPVAELLELTPQRDVVVDLAVEQRQHGRVLVGGRLIAAVEVDQRQPAHREPRAELGKRDNVLLVGTAIAHRARQALERVLELGGRETTTEDARDAAHRKPASSEMKLRNLSAPPCSNRIDQLELDRDRFAEVPHQLVAQRGEEQRRRAARRNAA